MESTEKIVAQRLLDIKAIQLNVAQPYTWASGWHAPIYCDTRKVLSYPDIRKLIYESLQQLITQNFEDVEYIAGVATGAIAHGVLVAEAMHKPFVYVRSTPKDHGLSNSIEGDLPQGARVIVVEDLVSTGGSSLQVVETLRKAGAEVVGLTAIFSYNFTSVRRKFENANCVLYTLTNYITLIEEALKRGYIKPEEMETLEQWRETPDKWPVDSSN
jgi:orotate phosphoribosyltransferase